MTRIALSGFALVVGLGVASNASAALRIATVEPSRAPAGQSVDLVGQFPDRQNGLAVKVFRLQRSSDGSFTPQVSYLRILDWFINRIVVEIPLDMQPGNYMIFVTDPGSPLFSSNQKHLEIVPGAARREPNPERALLTYVRVVEGRVLHIYGWGLEGRGGPGERVFTEIVLWGRDHPWPVRIVENSDRYIRAVASGPALDPGTYRLEVRHRRVSTYGALGLEMHSNEMVVLIANEGFSPGVSDVRDDWDRPSIEAIIPVVLTNPYTAHIVPGGEVHVLGKNLIEVADGSQRGRDRRLVLSGIIDGRVVERELQTDRWRPDLITGVWIPGDIAPGRYLLRVSVPSHTALFGKGMSLTIHPGANSEVGEHHYGLNPGRSGPAPPTNVRRRRGGY